MAPMTTVSDDWLQCEKALGSSAGQEQGRDRWGLFDISIVATSKSAPY